MPARHLIRFLPERRSEWLALGRDGRVLAGPQAGLPDSRADDTVVVLPADDVLLLRTPRIATQRRQLEQAIPYAIEDQLAAPVEQQHVALAERNEGDAITVAVVARATLDGYLEQLRAAGISPDRAVPESLLLPHAAGVPTVFVDGTRAVLRHGDSSVFAGALVELPSWLDLLADTGQTPGRVRWIGAADGVASLPSGWSADVEPCPSPLRWLATRLGNATPAIDLLQGDYAATRHGNKARGLWRWAAVLAAVALLAAFTEAGIERWQLQQQYEVQQAQMESLLRDAMPGVTRIVDPKAQLAAEVARQRGATGGSGALGLLARIAPVIAGSGNYTIDALDYRAGTVDLTLRTRDVAMLDALRESLAAQPGVQVELTSAVPGSDGVEGKLRVRGGGA